MSSWVEIKICFADLPEPLQIKRQLLNLLYDHHVPNIVESYYDGIASDESPEQAEAAILSGDDNLPVVVYVQSELDLEMITRLIESEFGKRLQIHVRRLDDSELNNAWSEGAVFETSRFVIATNIENQHRKKYTILINPGTAFGNGQHVSTLAILSSLEGANLESKSVLDIGTGNGVLLIAAAALGAARLVGTDLSDDIMEEASANLARNQVLAKLLITSEVPVAVGPFDLVLCNIPIPGIRPLLPDLIAATTTTAEFIFSGFTLADGQLFAKELERFGLSVISECNVRGWSAISLKKMAIT